MGYCPHPLCCKELDTTEQLTHTKIYIKKYMYVYIYLKRSKNGWGKVSRKIRALSQSGGGGGHSVMPNSMRPIDCRTSGCSLLSHSLYDPKDCSPPGSSIHRESPGNNNGVGCHALLQESSQLRLPCTSLSPGVCSDSCPSSW